MKMKDDLESLKKESDDQSSHSKGSCCQDKLAHSLHNGGLRNAFLFDAHVVGVTEVEGRRFWLGQQGRDGSRSGGAGDGE